MGSRIEPKLLSRIAETGDNDTCGAETDTQKAVAEAAAALGWHDTGTISFVSAYAELLQRLNRHEEADKIEAQVQDILGPRDIEELLT